MVISVKYASEGGGGKWGAGGGLNNHLDSKGSALALYAYDMNCPLWAMTGVRNVPLMLLKAEKCILMVQLHWKKAVCDSKPGHLCMVKCILRVSE